MQKINLNDYIRLKNGDKSHFKYKEFIKSETALRYGIENTPTKSEWEYIELLVQNVLEPVRVKFGPMRITSGFRTKELCIKIGSSTNSNHARGQAADIESWNNKVPLYTILEWIYNNCEFRELIAEYFPDGWIHVAYRSGGNVKRLKLKDKKHNYKTVSIDYVRDIYGK